MEAFDPDSVPTVGQLLLELEELARSSPSSVTDEKAGWERTSLKPYVEVFGKFVEGLVKSGVRVKKGEFAVR